MTEFETCEEIWDLALLDEYLYSIRDRDLTIQKITSTDRGKKLTVTKCFPGRAPLCRFDGKLAMLTRDGMDVQIFDDDHKEFKQLAVIKVTSGNCFCFYSPVPTLGRTFERIYTPGE